MENRNLTVQSQLQKSISHHTYDDNEADYGDRQEFLIVLGTQTLHVLSGDHANFVSQKLLHSAHTQQTST